MKIAILFAYESSPYAGVVKPFINWAKGLKEEENCDVEFLLVEVGPKIAEDLSKLGLKFYDFPNPIGLSHFCKERGYELIFTDDYIERLKILDKIKGDFRKAVYAQVLYGVHAISAIHNPLSLIEKLIFSTAKCIPFSILKQRYTKLLKRADMIIANSQTTANLLHILYGIELDGVVYPPIDTEVFTPQRRRKKNQVLLYLGSHAGDADENFARKICKIVRSKNFEVLVMGNKILREKLKGEFGASRISGVSDEELARIYSESKLTVCPQKWEQFGYVAAESIACGTPVLAFNYMGPAEIITQTKLGLLANNEKEFLRILENIKERLKTSNLYKKGDFPLTIEGSTKTLIKMLESV